VGPLLAVLTLAACSPEFEAEPTLTDAFREASIQYQVPRDLLVAMSWTLTRLDDRGGMVAETGAVGLMDLRVNGEDPSTTAASQASGLAVSDIENSSASNIDAAAALMRQWADDRETVTGVTVDNLEAWYPLVAAWSGVDDPLIAEGFAAQVYGLLSMGQILTAPDGEVLTVEPTPLDWINARQPFGGSGLVAQYVPASTSNYTNDNRGPTDIDMIVVHTMEGSYSGAISWFQNSASGASAHYMVRSSDGQITQMVDEEDVAWHAGDWDTNARSIGIEHEGYVSNPSEWYTTAMYEASAALARDIADRNGVPLDRSHIIGHYEVPGCSNPGGGGVSCHTDPGSGWDWDRYLDLIKSGTAGGGSGPVLLKDGVKTGSFEAKVTAELHGVTRTCSGPITGSATAGRLYLTATCYLEWNGKSGDFPITWSAEGLDTSINGTMAVESYADSYGGDLNADGSTYARYSGSKELGGDVGRISYEVTVLTDP